MARLTEEQSGDRQSISFVVHLPRPVRVRDGRQALARLDRGEDQPSNHVSSRLVFGAASLPLGSPVELEVILEVKP
jgi:hypothetical protein